MRSSARRVEPNSGFCITIPLYCVEGRLEGLPAKEFTTTIKPTPPNSMKTAQDDLLTGQLANGFMLVLAFLSALGYVYLAQQYPAVFWYDAVTRLALRDQILLGHWLPLTQLVVFAISKITTNLILLRSCLALIAALTLVAIFRLAGRAFGFVGGLIAALLLASNLMFAALATVPYPEVLFVGLILTALYFLDQPSPPRNLILGMLALNLACLTRYEGWLLAAVIVLDTAIRCFGKVSWKSLIGQTAKMATLAGVAPLGWLVFGVNVPQGLTGRLQAVLTFEQDRLSANPFLPVIDPAHVRDFAANFYQLLSWQAGLPIILAGVAGWLIVFFKAPHRLLHVRILAFAALDWLLIALWRPWALDNLRQTFVAQVFLLFYAAYGLMQIVQIPSNWLTSLLGKSILPAWQNWAAAALAVSIAVSRLPQSVKFVADNARLPDFATSQQVGTWLNARLKPGDAIWVLSDNVFPAYGIATYTGRPFDQILDHRFDQQTIESRMQSANQIYILGLFGNPSGLSASERTLLGELETGQIPSQAYTVAGREIWVTSLSQMTSGS